jgi:hypothetical protein
VIDLASLGRWIAILGLILVITGGAIWLLGRTGLPVGRLPGDIRFERENVSCYVPIATMILVSLLLTVLLNVILRLLNR